MSNERSEIYEFENFRLDVSERILKHDDEKIQLSEKSFETLCALVRRANRLVSKDDLLAEVWPDAIVEENNLDKNISNLRNVLGERRGRGKFIETVRGHGFRFVPEVRRLVADADVAGEPISVETEPASATKPTATAVAPKPPGESARRRLFLFFAAVALLATIAVGVYFRYAAPPESRTINSIAVLPFKPLVAERRDEALEMGMTDTLISKLSGSDELSVRPLSSVRRYAALDQDSLAAGRFLQTEAVLDGTIQIAGDRIRVAARLVRVSDGRQLWAENFDEKSTDIFAVQDSISERVANALKIRLAAVDKKRGTENVEAYQLYMKGRFHHFKLNLADARKGIDYYNQAIAIDPNYALAYAGIADAYRSFSLTSDIAPEDVMPQAKAAARKAIELDETLADAHTALGFIVFFYDWDWNLAEKEFRRALELDPNNAEAHQAYAHLLSNLGRHAEALTEIRLSKQIDPLNLRSNALECQFLLHAGQVEAAALSLKKSIDLEPNFWMPHLFASSAYIELGSYEKAIGEGREAHRLSPSQNWSIAFSAYALAKAGRPDEARSVLVELLKLAETSYVPPYHFAMIYNGLGDSGKALDYLEKGFAGKDVRMVFLKVEPKWNNLRKEPRFAELMRRLNFG